MQLDGGFLKKKRKKQRKEKERDRKIDGRNKKHFFFISYTILH